MLSQGQAQWLIGFFRNLPGGSLVSPDASPRGDHEAQYAQAMHQQSQQAAQGQSVQGDFSAADVDGFAGYDYYDEEAS